MQFMTNQKYEREIATKYCILLKIGILHVKHTLNKFIDFEN